ncbi:unnamed protein product [Gongylonema pulchrum]|uniref:Uncharacterized protein n=1 Tax=Gongylonema pulchrum TaxID=637853 RepID=A0A183DAT3_9BILA|nr:unnamed protein product [Gongylonema pulchrum]
MIGRSSITSLSYSLMIWNHSLRDAFHLIIRSTICNHFITYGEFWI